MLNDVIVSAPYIFCVPKHRRQTITSRLICSVYGLWSQFDARNWHMACKNPALDVFDSKRLAGVNAVEKTGSVVDNSSSGCSIAVVI